MRGVHVRDCSNESCLPDVFAHVLSGLLLALLLLGPEAFQGGCLQQGTLLLPVVSIIAHRAPAFITSFSVSHEDLRSTDAFNPRPSEWD